MRVVLANPAVDLGALRGSRTCARRCPCLACGVGMSDEYPKVYYREDRPAKGCDGVKLEQMVRVNEDGGELLSSYPFGNRLL